MTKIYIFYIVMLLSVSPTAALTMEQRRQWLQAKAKLFAQHKQQLESGRHIVTVLELIGATSKEEVLASIKNSVQMCSAAQYKILQVTHQTYFVEDDKIRMNISKVQRFDGTWREVRVSEDEKRAILQQEVDFLAHYPKVEKLLSSAEKKVKKTVDAAQDILEQYQPLR